MDKYEEARKILKELENKGMMYWVRQIWATTFSIIIVCILCFLVMLWFPVCLAPL